AQMLLEKWAEPLTALEIGSWKLEVGNAVQSQTSNLQLLNLAWKYLLQNHPHDSICGCGVDQTHTEMALRFDWVEQIVEPLIAENLAKLTAAIDTRVNGDAMPIVVFNPVAGPRTDLVAAQIESPGGWEDFVITDNSGNVMPFQIKNRRVKEYYHKHAKGQSLGGILGMVQAGRVMGMAVDGVSIAATVNPIRVDVTLKAHGDPDSANLAQWQQQFRDVITANPNTFFEIRGHSPTQLDIEFIVCDVPGYGYKTFAVSKTKSTVSASSDESLVVENEFYRVEPNVADGTLNVIDKTTGTHYRGANRFVDGGDRGDLYNFCPPENDRLVRQSAVAPHIKCEKNTAKQSLHISMVYKLPQELTADRTGRAQETADTKIDTIVWLYPGVRRIDFQTHVENLARDHRLQVEFPLPIVSAHVDAEQAFDVVRRPLDLPQDTADWIEQPRPEGPMQNFVSVSDGKTGMTLAARGLPEYQARRDSEGTTLALTLLRCVGWLSRDDLSTRRDHAGPAMETPG
ncbi:hypothetical protein ANRL3_01339, partial [Anaerolineae bacterium]